MKQFSVAKILKNVILFSLTGTFFLFQSCATHEMQLNKNSNKNQIYQPIDSSKIEHTFFLIGDAGNADRDYAKLILHTLEKKLEDSNKNATLLFLGDNIYPVGMPADKNNPKYTLAELKLTNQLELAKNFKGKTIFIPGNHDWYSGLKGLQNQAKLVTEYTKDKKSFLPRNGCAIEEVKIDKETILITIDTQWFLNDWDENPGINDDCDIKTREAFFEELESVLNKNQDKIKIIAMHHPLMSGGTHGGHHSFKKQLFPFESDFPLPVFGSLINLMRKTSGRSPQDLLNKQYQILTKRVTALLQGQDKVIVVSGHDHNLQYMEKDNVVQIISGAGSKSEAAKAIGPNDFSYGGNGYVTLNIMKNGEILITYYGMENGQEKLLWQNTINKLLVRPEKGYPESFPQTTSASIYTKEMTNKTLVHNWFLGSHYKDLYSRPIVAKTATLDTLYGGLKPAQAGGGHQSKSLRLKDSDDKEYVMRALKKSAARFLQAVAFKDQYVENQFENTYAENFLLDFYTTSHPYTPFVVGNLADKIGVSHTNPELFYIPKQDALDEFNKDFGDELYMVEERPTDSQKDLASFGKPEAIIGTDDLLKNLQKDEKYSVDEKSYIKARLFDMLIGDWDRHFDQWRWGEYKEGEKVIYKPIPRDRDQAFSKYDGAILAIVMNIPDLRHMQTFKDKISNVKWFNREPYPLDIAFIKNSSKNDWKEQAKYIQDNLSDEDIVSAFKNLPVEMQDETIETIKAKLKVRKSDLQQYASEYYKVLQKTILIVGTNKKDKFVIDKIKKNTIEIKQYRIKNDGEELVLTKEIKASQTCEVWIYGLDDDDVFEVTGKAKSHTKVRLIGGENNDSYNVQNGKKIIVYDFKSKKNEYKTDNQTKKVITDDYETNMYDYKKPKFNAWTGLPSIGYNPDDGVKFGAVVNYTKNGFKQNPYTQKHTFKANYYFATDGIEASYDVKFPQAVGNWNIEIETRATSANFAINYFGFGNETINNDDDEGMDYNRVKIQQYRLAPMLKKVGSFGSEVSFQLTMETIEVEGTQNRFINLPAAAPARVFEHQQFAGVTAKYSYENSDNKSNPTLGMGFMISGSWKTNVKDENRNFPTLESKLNFNHKIDPKGRLVLATLLKGKMLLNNNFEFYQGATLGGDYDLRGFRNERFLGKSSFFQSSDLRVNIGTIKGSLVPMTYGLLGGFDYGRVWIDGEDSDKWHHSYGGGLWLNGLNVVTARLTFFKSEIDGARIAFGLGFGF